MVTVFLDAVNPCVQGGNVPAAEYVINAIIESVLVISYAHSNAGFGICIVHEPVEYPVGI